MAVITPRDPSITRVATRLCQLMIRVLHSMPSGYGPTRYPSNCVKAQCKRKITGLLWTCILLFALQLPVPPERGIAVVPERSSRV